MKITTGDLVRYIGNYASLKNQIGEVTDLDGNRAFVRFGTGNFEALLPLEDLEVVYSV